MENVPTNVTGTSCAVSSLVSFLFTMVLDKDVLNMKIFGAMVTVCDSTRFDSA